MEEFLSLYKVLDGFARIVCWLAIVCTFPYAIFIMFYIIAELSFRSHGLLENLESIIPGLLWVFFILLVLLSTTYPQKPEKLTYKFWGAAFFRHACAWPVVGWAILHAESVLIMGKVAGKWWH
jgi:hypothetical protein